jgi:hypothetical protein
MPKRLLALWCALSACGGTWSNRDLEFAAALPSREALRSKLPTTAASSSPLTGVARDGLNVGDPSKAYAEAKSAATTFNGMLDFFLTVLDKVRTLAPTTRTTDSRTWGPYADQNNSGFEFLVTIAQRSADTFEWQMRSQNPTTGQSLSIVEGTFLATATAHVGQGKMTVNAAQFRDVLKVDEGLRQLDQIVIDYFTNTNPVRVSMHFALKPGATSGIFGIDYTYLERSDRSGTLSYEVRAASTLTTVLQTTAGWVASGEGHARAVVKEGTYAGATLDECWDTGFKVTWYAEGWVGGTTNGLESACPVVPDL